MSDVQRLRDRLQVRVERKVSRQKNKPGPRRTGVPGTRYASRSCVENHGVVDEARTSPQQQKKNLSFWSRWLLPKVNDATRTKTRFASSASPVAGATVVVVGAAAAVAASSPSLRATRASVDK